MNAPLDTAILEFYAGLPQQGPGSDADAEAALSTIVDRLPADLAVADFGCGTGRSTLFLAERLRTRLIAVELAAPFCERLARDAELRGLSDFIDIRQADMSDPPIAASSLDLLWCEGAAYIIGFADALKRWRGLLKSGGFCVVSECSWLSEKRPERVERFFKEGYPEMTTVAGNMECAEDQGYRPVATHIVSAAAWSRYYDAILRAIRDGAADHLGTDFIRELRDEIAVFEESAGSYGYVFYILQKTS